MRDENLGGRYRVWEGGGLLKRRWNLDNGGSGLGWFKTEREEVIEKKMKFENWERDVGLFKTKGGVIIFICMYKKIKWNDTFQ